VTFWRPHGPEWILCLFKDEDRISMFSVIEIDRELPPSLQVSGKG